MPDTAALLGFALLSFGLVLTPGICCGSPGRR